MSMSKPPDDMLNTSPQFVSDNNNNHQLNISNTFSVQTVTNISSYSNGCQTVNFTETGEYLPWDNPDNIVSAEVEAVSQAVKDFGLVIIFLIGGPANVINMAVFFKQSLKDRVNLCLFALSLADELYLIAAMFHHAEQVYLHFTTKEKYGFMIAFMNNNHLTGLLGFFYVSQALSAVIATERCYCILQPLKYQTLMRNRTMIAIIVIVNVVLVSLYFIAASRFYITCVYYPETDIVVRKLVIGEWYKNHQQLVDYVDGFVFGAGVPVIVLIVVIISTLITTVKLRQIVTWRSETSSSISAREVALTKVLVGTSILFIICGFPLAVARISWFFMPEMNSDRRNQNFYLTTLWINELLSYINSSFNIFVYYYMGSRYRGTLWCFFKGKTNTNNMK